MNQLWDTETMNAVAEFPSLLHTLAYVRDEKAAYGSDAVATWMLLSDDGHGDLIRLAVGGELAHYAEAALLLSAN